MVSLLFVFVGLGTLFSGDFNRRGSNWRLLFAVAAAVSLQALTFALMDLIVRAPDLIPLVYLLFAIMVGVAWYVVALDPFRRTPQPTGSAFN